MRDKISITMIEKKDLEFIFERINLIEKKLKPNPIDFHMTVDGIIKKFPELTKERVTDWFNKGHIKGHRIGKAIFVDTRTLLGLK